MKVRWTSRAARSLTQIANYIDRDNPKAAAETVEQIRRAANRLAETPHMGRLGRVEGTLELVVAPYIIPYRIKGEEAQILHVFHTRRRFPESF